MSPIRIGKKLLVLDLDYCKSFSHPRNVLTTGSTIYSGLTTVYRYSRYRKVEGAEFPRYRFYATLPSPIPPHRRTVLRYCHLVPDELALAGVKAAGARIGRRSE